MHTFFGALQLILNPVKILLLGFLAPLFLAPRSILRTNFWIKLVKTARDVSFSHPVFFREFLDEARTIGLPFQLAPGVHLRRVVVRNVKALPERALLLRS